MMNDIISHFDLFLLVCLRILAFLAASPLTSTNVWPNWSKIALSFGLAYMVVPNITSPVPSVFSNPGQYVFDALLEIVAGLALGFIATLIFSAISFAGQAVDIQIGLGLSQLLAPGSSSSSGIFGNLYNMLFTLYFLGMGGLDGLMMAILHSFQVIPIGGLRFPSNWPELLLHLMGVVMSLGIELAAPLLTALFLSDATFAFLSRAVPQMNVFVVGLPVKIFVGLTVFAMVMPGTLYVFNLIFLSLFNQLQSMLQAMGG